jgi:hypothetical protein
MSVTDPKRTWGWLEQLLCLVCALTVEAKMNGLQFTDEAARQLEKAYLTRDVIAQRSETIRRLIACSCSS